MKDKFPLVKLIGSPKEIGFQHGRLLKNRIHKTVLWYQDIIQTDLKNLKELAQYYRSIIQDFNPKYCEEIDAIGSGSGMDPVWIYMLNARSEIMNKFRNECTSLYFTDSALIGQNWDWAQELEELAVIMKIEPKNGPKILQMTEPGIIGKIGFNSNHLGVLLNFLESGQECDGVPVHILLRSILESTNMEDAITTIEQEKLGKSANIILGNHLGKYIDYEFAGEHVYTPSVDASIFLHTNHYLGADITDKNNKKFASTFARYKRGLDLLNINPDQSLDDMKQILLDKHSEILPICRPYEFHPDIGNAGTICSIIMDLPNLIMHITPGNPFQYDFIDYSF